MIKEKKTNMKVIKTCKNCEYTTNNVDDNFCPHCGTKLINLNLTNQKKEIYNYLNKIISGTPAKISKNSVAQYGINYELAPNEVPSSSPINLRIFNNFIKNINMPPLMSYKLNVCNICGPILELIIYSHSELYGLVWHRITIDFTPKVLKIIEKNGINIPDLDTKITDNIDGISHKIKLDSEDLSKWKKLQKSKI